MSVDKYVQPGNVVCGVGDLNRRMISGLLGGVPQVIWASPVCSVWSKLGWHHHWDAEYYRQYGEFKPKTKFAFESIQMLRDVIKILSWYPDAVFFIENPEGMLFKHPVINELHQLCGTVRRHVVTYCAYGFDVRKPTHLWTNSRSFSPLPVCGYSNDCHLNGSRGGHFGILSKRSSYERSKVPPLLIEACLDSAVKDLSL